MATKAPDKKSGVNVEKGHHRLSTIAEVDERRSMGEASGEASAKLTNHQYSALESYIQDS